MIHSHTKKKSSQPIQLGVSKADLARFLEASGDA